MTQEPPPSPYALWVRAGGGWPRYSPEEYLRLMRVHGHILPRSDGMPDPEGPTRWRVLVGFELTAASSDDAYREVLRLVAERNGKNLAADLQLTVGPIGRASVSPISGALADEERAAL